jgi:hypothetical protein
LKQLTPNNSKCLGLLLKAGADVNAKMKANANALYVAAQVNEPHVAF